MASLDLTNQKFNKLTAIERIPYKNNRTHWRCLCECGNEAIVQTSDLTSGHTKSCGCLRKIGNKKIDISNQRFGKLIALKPTEKRLAHCVVWECLCDCGTITFVGLNDLKSGNTKSCGCLKSAGEEKIMKILQNNNILFNHQKTMLSCKFPDTNSCAIFDFYIETPEENNGYYLIEYDGIQHFQTKTGGWNNQEHLEQTRKRDNYKNKWCKDNNITLIRIPYTRFKDLNINDLIPERSSYVI